MCPRDQFAAVVDTVIAHQQDVEAELDSMARDHRALSSRWEGDAWQAYDAATRKKRRLLTDRLETLGLIARSVNVSRVGYVQTESQVVALWA